MKRIGVRVLSDRPLGGFHGGDDVLRRDKHPSSDLHLRVDGAELDGIHYLRAFGNSDAIRADAEKAERVVMIGGSYIGCEVAASLQSQGTDTAIVMMEDHPLANGFGDEVGRWFGDLLESKGVEVSYAIHPVAGRMPGHMNVLLAEANVPYTQLKEMDEANPEFARTDVAVVVGANDVVNPDARNNAGSPIYGMPILDVDNAQTVVVLKRSMNPGFAGIENPLFYNPKTVMLFGDAKQSVEELIQDVKTL